MEEASGLERAKVAVILAPSASHQHIFSNRCCCVLHFVLDMLPLVMDDGSLERCFLLNLFATCLFWACWLAGWKLEMPCSAQATPHFSNDSTIIAPFSNNNCGIYSAH
jgi:hypothetical protein